MMNKKYIMLLTALFLLIVHVSALQAKDSDSSDFVDIIDQTMVDLLNKYRVPGAAVAIIENNEMIYAQGFGVGNKKEGWPVTADTVFQVGSIAKSVAALGVMRLVSDGFIQLDAPAEKYLTQWKFPDSKYDASNVTIRRLLSHTAGLSPRGYIGYHPSREIPSLMASLTGEARRGKAVRIRKEPGVEFSYSGGGYSILELVIEEVAGETFSEYMNEMVFSPIDMRNSSYDWPDYLQEKTATGYSVFGTAFPTYLFAEKAAAGLFSTVNDLAKMMMVLMKDFKGIDSVFLSQELVREMFSPIERYGLGFDVYHAPSGEKIVSHGGSNQGWKSFMAMIPERGSGIVILANSDRAIVVYQEITNLWAEYQQVGYRIRGPGFLQMFFSDLVVRLMHLYY